MSYGKERDSMKIVRNVWVIMSKDRTVIAKGVPRNRYLIKVDDEKDNKRILVYQSELRAKKAFMDDWFYAGKGTEKIGREDLEAVKVTEIIEEVYETIQLSNPINSYWNGLEKEYNELIEKIQDGSKKR
jgi:hypothetical protein